MIRMVQRRLIIPRGDTGSFSIPYLKHINQGDVAVFTIFDVITHTKLFQKVVAAEGDVLNIAFSHNETVNLQPGKYLWDIKIYTNPQFVDDELVNGEEIDSYYAGFSLPECEIRETGDSLLMSDDTPQAKLAPDQIDLISAAITATQTAKEVAMNSAADAETSASAAATSAQVASDSKDAALASQTSAATSESNAAESAAAAQESATQAAQIAQQIHEEIPTKVSDLVDDSGHYTKPATGIPASDLEETYLKFTDYPTYDGSTSGVVKVYQSGFGVQVNNGLLSVAGANRNIIKDGSDTFRPITPSGQHNATFYGLAKAAGHDEKDSKLPVGQYTDAAKAAIQAMLDVPSTADIPTNVSELTNDAGYLTEHQDISSKANSADLAAVATSGSYEDLEDKPTIPEVPVQDVQINSTSILENGVANIPLATDTKFGVVKVWSDLGIGKTSGILSISSANEEMIKSGTNSRKPITPVRQHQSVFYGLATAAGDTTQSQSDNAVGTYTDSAKAAIQTMLDVPSTSAVTSEIATAIGSINSFDMAVVQALPTEDISTHTIYLVPKTGETNDVYDEYVYINSAWEMVGNTQIDLSNYVQKTDYATHSEAGVVKISSNYGIKLSEGGTLQLAFPSDSVIKTGTNDRKAIAVNTLHIGTFYGLAKAAGDTTQSQSDNAVGTYTDEAKAAIQQMLDVPSNSDIPDVSIYATKADTILDTTLSRGRKEGTMVGTGSVAFGFTAEASGNYSQAFGANASASGGGSCAYGINTIASGNYSHAEGNQTTSSGNYSHAEGYKNIASGSAAHAEGYQTTSSSTGTHSEGKNTIASGQYAHAEGNGSFANGIRSHAEGYNTITLASDSHASGKYNVADSYSSWPEWIPNTSYAIGDKVKVTTVADSQTVVVGYICKTDNSDIEFTVANWNVDIAMNYVDIIGNGSSDSARSNAYALDWQGNGHYMGSIYVGANADSTGGTKVLCEADFATAQDIQNIINGGAGA